MLGTLLSFCLMAIGARELSGEIGTFQVLFFRGVIALTVISAVIFATGQQHLLRTRRLILHTIRNLFHFAGQYGWFVGIGLLPLAQVFALEFTVPLWTAVIAALFLGEQLTKRKLIAILLGFIGVLIIVRPGIEIVSPAALIVLTSAVCYAVSHSSTKSLARSEHPLTILFLMCFIQLPVGFTLALPEWQLPQGTQWLWLAIIGVTALTAHYCMTKAMQHADVSIVVTMDFLRLPVIALVGVFLYQEEFELALLVGALLMLVGNLFNLYPSNNKAPNQPRTEADN